MHMLILFEKKNVFFFKMRMSDSSVSILYSYQLAPDIQLCSSFSLYIYILLYIIHTYLYINMYDLSAGL